MTKQGAFNTGRKYSPNGQRIGWIVIRVDTDPDFDSGMFDVSHVIFWDIDRAINGLMRVIGTVNEESIMLEYDSNRYQSANSANSAQRSFMTIAGKLAESA